MCVDADYAAGRWVGGYSLDWNPLCWRPKQSRFQCVSHRRIQAQPQTGLSKSPQARADLADGSLVQNFQMFLYSSDSTVISWQRWCMSNVVTAIHSLSHNTEDVFQSSRPTLYCGVENNRNNQINKSRPFWHEHARILLMLICLCPNGTSLSVSTAWMVDVSTKHSTTNTNVALMSSFRPKLMWRLGWWSGNGDLGKTLFFPPHFLLFRHVVHRLV